METSNATLRAYETGNPADAISTLYAKGNRATWDPHDVVDWAPPLETENPLGLPMFTLPVRRSTWFWGLVADDRVSLARDYQSWLVSQFLHGEHYGLVTACRIATDAPGVETKLFAATQAADEARHIDVFRRLSAKLGTTWPVSPTLASMLDSALSSEGLESLYLGMHVFTEVLGLASFVQVRRTTSNARVKEIFSKVMGDEGRHVAFGRIALGAFYREMSEAELRDRDVRVVHWCELVSERLLALEVWQKYGFERQDATAYLATSPSYIGYRVALFRELAGTLRDVGLWRPAIQSWFAHAGVELPASRSQ